MDGACTLNGDFMTTFDDREQGYERKFALDAEQEFKQPGDEDVLRKVAGDLKGSGVAVSEGDVRRKMDELLAQAREQIKKGV